MLNQYQTFPNTENPRTLWPCGWIILNIKEGLILKKTKTLPNLFYEVCSTLPKSDKDATRKDYRLMSLMNIDAKILANQIQQHIVRIIYHPPSEIYSSMQEYLNIHKLINVIYHINRMKGKNHMIISIDV